MGNGFFRDGPAADPVYGYVRHPSNEILERARAFIEDMWRECGPYVDRRVPAWAMADLMSVWWELYLAYTIVRWGKQIIPRAHRQPKYDGPDLLVAPNIATEAVAPTNGEGEDAIETPTLGVAYDVPNEKFILRLRSAVKAKSDRFRAYRNRGWIGEHDPVIIAVSAGRLEYRYQEYIIPRIVQALYGAGVLTITMDRETRRTTGYYAESRSNLTNTKGALVSTDVFVASEHRQISAVLYSTADCANFPHIPGADCLLVHNPNADNPLPENWLPVRAEYWLDGDSFRCFTRESVHTTVSTEPDE